MRPARCSVHLLTLWTAVLVACPVDPSEDTDGPVLCVTHTAPTFQLGTGAATYEPLVDGQDLVVQRGFQGGCHVWLAVRTDGFAERLFEIAYTLFDADTGQSTGDSSSTRVRLLPSGGPEGGCEAAGYFAIMRDAEALVGKRIRVDVRVKDALDRQATASKTVRVVWPPEGPLPCR